MNIESVFAALSVEMIDEFIATQQEENLFLDFKMVATNALTQSDDKRNLARALSGFANSSGGLVVWGVDARKNADGVDCAVRKEPIENLSLFLSRLNELTGSYVTPHVENVRHRAVVERDNAGFAITIVPESDRGPHMAKGGEDRYFKRSGDSFYRMEHFDVADMFGRRAKPVLNFHTRIIANRHAVGGSGTSYMGILVLGIANSGRAVAKAPYLEIDVASPYKMARYGLDGNGHEGLPRLAHAASASIVRYGAGADIVIHPGTILDVAAVELAAVATHSRKIEMPPELIVSFSIAAEGAPKQAGAVTVTQDDIASALYPSDLYVGKDERAKIAAAAG